MVTDCDYLLLIVIQTSSLIYNFKLNAFLTALMFTKEKAAYT
jgi:hypothetical protein